MRTWHGTLKELVARLMQSIIKRSSWCRQINHKSRPHRNLELNASIVRRKEVKLTTQQGRQSKVRTRTRSKAQIRVRLLRLDVILSTMSSSKICKHTQASQAQLSLRKTRLKWRHLVNSQISRLTHQITWSILCQVSNSMSLRTLNFSFKLKMLPQSGKWVRWTSPRSRLSYSLSLKASSQPWLRASSKILNWDSFQTSTTRSLNGHRPVMDCTTQSRQSSAWLRIQRM